MSDDLEHFHCDSDVNITATPDSIISNKQHREDIALSMVTSQAAETRGEELEEYCTDIRL